MEKLVVSWPTVLGDAWSHANHYAIAYGEAFVPRAVSAALPLAAFVSA